ncbi:flagellar basal body rod C-terminal domain-containing protein [candidate division KSB1 bacterium]
MADNSLTIAASGLHAANKRISVSAHNSANVTTKKFKKQQVLDEELPGGGVKSRVRTVDTAGVPEKDPVTGEQTEGSNVNIAEEQVDRINASAAAKMNANVIRTSDDMLGTIVNIKK